MFYKQILSKTRILPSYPSNHWGLVIKEHWYEPSHVWTHGTKPKPVKFCDTKLNLLLIAEIRINRNFLPQSQTVVVWMNRDQRPGYLQKVECNHPGPSLVPTAEAISCSVWKENWSISHDQKAGFLLRGTLSVDIMIPSCNHYICRTSSFLCQSQQGTVASWFWKQ